MFSTFFHERRWKIDGPYNSKGFSLIELIVVIAIVAIVGGIGYPRLMKIRNNVRTRGVTSDIFSSFRHAQSTAVKQNADVTLQFKAAGTYLAFVDNGEGGGTADDGVVNGSEQTLFSETVKPGTSIAADFSTVFTSRGRPSGIGNVTIQNNSDPNLQYRISLSLAGRTDIKVSTDGGATWK